MRAGPRRRLTIRIIRPNKKMAAKAAIHASAKARSLFVVILALVAWISPAPSDVDRSSGQAGA
jgi:hypothetical protein